MTRDLDSPRSRFHALFFRVKLKAARDFGLDQATADAIALGFDPRVRNVGHLIDALRAP